MRMAWVQSGTVLLALGLCFCTLGGEGLAIFNACVGNPSCGADASVATLQDYLVVVVTGVLLAVVGVVVALAGMHLAPRPGPTPVEAPRMPRPWP